MSELFAQLLADGRTTVLSELLETARRDCRPFGQQLEPMVLEIEVKVNELADIFSLALPDGLEYRDVLAEAHRQIVHVTTQAAEDLLRTRAEEDFKAEDDWFVGDIDALSEALHEVCATPIESDESSAKADSPAVPGDADSRQRRRADAAVATAVRPSIAAGSDPPAKTKPASGRAAPDPWTV